MSPRSAVIAALACLAIGLTGCAGTPSTKTINIPIPASSRLQLTGTALKSALLPLSDFPPGYQIDTRGTQDSGPTLVSGTTAPAPQNCPQMIKATNYPTAGLTAGVIEFLDDTTIDHRSIHHQRSFDERIYQFATTSGSTGYFDLVRSMTSHCLSVTERVGAATMVFKQMASLATPVAGHEALLVRGSTTIGGANAVSIDLYVIDGTDVYVVGSSVVGVPLTAQPSSLAALMAKLIVRVQAIG
jgi:hypothetical protein